MIATSLAVLGLVVVAPSQEVERESFEVWLCPVHRDEQATGPKKCPVCDRDMVQRLLVPSYSCPMHQHIDDEEPGQCPVCNMKLVPTTRELEWFCPENPEIESSMPGECPNGSSMHLRSIPMAHGDHNPKHGGILFMAPNGFHHIEGTIDDSGHFRLYVYNDFTKPVDAEGFSGRVGQTALEPAPEGAFLTADVGAPDSYPTELVVHVAFPGAHEEEARFDFVFAGASVEGAAPAPALALPEFRIPATAEGIFDAIMERDARIQELIQRGVWPDLYIPALEAKDLVLALAQEDDRVAVPAKKLVRAAWLLDNYGDLGNRLEVEKAYLLFEQSIRELESVRAP